MYDQGTSDGYGALAGFGGPALEAQNAPVVRYQDLHRSHAPASAGAPEVAYGDVMAAPEGVYGDVAVANGPVVEQVPGYGGMSSSRPLYGSGYGAADDLPLVRGTGVRGPNVDKIQGALVVLDLLPAAKATGTYDNDTAEAVKTVQSQKGLPATGDADKQTFDTIVDAADKKRKAAAPARGAKAEKSQRDYLSVLEDLGRGAAAGLAREAGVSRFESSGKATTPVSGGEKRQVEEKSDWQTYAIWGGAAVAGIGVAYLLYRSYSKSGKGA